MDAAEKARREKEAELDQVINAADNAKTKMEGWRGKLFRMERPLTEAEKGDFIDNYFAESEQRKMQQKSIQYQKDAEAQKEAQRKEALKNRAKTAQEDRDINVQNY